MKPYLEVFSKKHIKTLIASTDIDGLRHVLNAAHFLWVISNMSCTIVMHIITWTWLYA